MASWVDGRQLPLGKLIKPPILFWGYLILNPALEKLASMDQTETRSHGARVEVAQGRLCIAEDQVGLVSRREVEM